MKFSETASHFARPSAALTNRTYASEAQLPLILEAWRLLHQRLGKTVFTDPDLFLAWWEHMGRARGAKLHVTTLWEGEELVALAPLAVTRRKGMRVLHWGGTEVFDYCDILAETPRQAEQLWKTVRRSHRYDMAIIKSVEKSAAAYAPLERFALTLKQERNHYLPLAWTSSEEWLASLPYAQRKEYNRRLRQLEEKGPLHFEVTRQDGKDAPALTSLLQQKKLWCRSLKRYSIFCEPGVDGFFRQLTGKSQESGHGYLAFLRCGDTIIASHMGFIDRGAVCWYMPSYDVEWSGFSPGKVLMMKAIAWAIDQGYREFDLMRGEKPFKGQLTKEARILTDFCFSRGVLGRSAEWAYLRRLARMQTAASTVKKETNKG